MNSLLIKELNDQIAETVSGGHHIVCVTTPCDDGHHFPTDLPSPDLDLSLPDDFKDLFDTINIPFPKSHL